MFLKQDPVHIFDDVQQFVLSSWSLLSVLKYFREILMDFPFRQSVALIDIIVGKSISNNNNLEKEKQKKVNLT